MNRRTVLAGAGLTLTAGTGVGCLSRPNCPDPDLGEELSYEEREPRDSALINMGNEGVILLTASDDVDRFVDENRPVGDEDEQWIRATEFDEAIVVGVQVGSSGGSSDLKIRGVERESPGAVHVYSCIATRGMTDDWASYAKLLRIPHQGKIPDRATHTHWEAGDREVYSISE